jgi:hypothetical protein
VQLLECQTPSVTLNIKNTTIGTEVNASQNSSDEYQWEYNDITLYHKHDWYSKVWCDIGIDKIEYDFGDGYSTTSTHTFDNVDDVEIKCRVTNKCGLIAEDSTTIRVFKNEPTLELEYSPNEVRTNDDITLSTTVDDPDETYVNEVWYIDGNEVTENVIQLSTTGEHEFKVELKWNDGFSDNILTKIKTISILNEPPTVNLVANVNETVVTFNTNANDPEGNLDYTKVYVYVDKDSVFNSNATSNTWVLLDEFETKTDLNTIEFLKNGLYKIEIKAYDTDGASSTIDSYVVNISTCSENTGVTGTDGIRFVSINNYLLGDVDSIPTIGDVSTTTLEGSIEDKEIVGDIQAIELVHSIDDEEIT